MAQQTDALLGRFNEEFEDPNAGVSGGEPEEAGPGMVGKILTKFGHRKERAAGHGSTPSTPTGVQAQQQHDLEGLPHKQSRTDQVHKDAVGAAGGPVGDGVETSAPVGGGARSVEAAGSSPRGNGHFIRDAGTPASPKLPRKDLGERIMDKLPGTHANPYSVGVADPPYATNSYTDVGYRSTVPTSPSAHRSSTLSSPSLIGKLKNILTGQQPSKGTATENATTGTAGTTGEQQPMHDGYVQSPTPDTRRNTYEKAKETSGHSGPDAGSAETWPSPSSISSATRTDAEGQPIEGPTRPVSEDTKKDGLMIKLMDKLHIHDKSSSPRATAADVGTGTPTATSDTRPSQETGTPTRITREEETTIGTATGPAEN